MKDSTHRVFPFVRAKELKDKFLLSKTGEKILNIVFSRSFDLAIRLELQLILVKRLITVLKR